MKKTTKAKAKRVVKQKAAEVATDTVDKVVAYASDLDYKKIATNALKVAVPLVIAKMIHSQYQKSHSKSSQWEKKIAPLFDEIKAKLKDM